MKQYFLTFSLFCAAGFGQTATPAQSVLDNYNAARKDLLDRQRQAQADATTKTNVDSEIQARKDTHDEAMKRLEEHKVNPSTIALQQAGSDPGGWTKAKWGMTKEQVADLFSENQIKPSEHEGELVIPSYLIDNYKFAAVLSFGKNGFSGVHLINQKTLVDKDGNEKPFSAIATPSQVQINEYQTRHVTSWVARANKKANDNLSAQFNATSDALNQAVVNESMVETMKTFILSDLTDKYGLPTNHVVAYTEEFVWLLQGTKITLMWNHDKGTRNLDNLNIFYGVRTVSSSL